MLLFASCPVQWEMATGMRAFADVPKFLLAAAVLRDKARPEWPAGSSSSAFLAAALAAAGPVEHSDGSSSVLVPELTPPMAYRRLAEACWAQEPQDRWARHPGV